MDTRKMDNDELFDELYRLIDCEDVFRQRSFQKEALQLVKAIHSRFTVTDDGVSGQPME